MANEGDVEWVKRALAGDAEACARFESPEVRGRLEAVLIKRGASATEAGDLAADLLADCFGAREGKPPLLEAYNGKGPVQGFLTRAAINRLIDLKRRDRFRGELPERGLEGGPADEFDLLPGEECEDPEDDALVGVIRDALLHAFSTCDPRDLMLLRLVVVHGVRQEKAAAVFGWSQSKVSRAMSGVMEKIRIRTLEEVRKSDPWLELGWEDFLALCRSSTDFLVGAGR